MPARRKASDLSEDFGSLDYLTDIRISDKFDHLGEPLKAVEDGWHLDIEVIYVYRGEAVTLDKDEITFFLAILAGLLKWVCKVP